jgi:hypothetical protein
MAPACRVTGGRQGSIGRTRAPRRFMSGGWSIDRVALRRTQPAPSSPRPRSRDQLARPSVGRSVRPHGGTNEPLTALGSPIQRLVRAVGSQRRRAAATSERTLSREEAGGEHTGRPFCLSRQVDRV